MLGIIQEQHPDRARLFMQWKEMGWPILVDSYNLLEVPYVPITVALDEAGVVTKLLGPLQDEGPLGSDFVAETFPASEGAGASPPAVPDHESLAQTARAESSPESWRAFGDAVAVWGGPDRATDAIEAFEEVVRATPDDGLAHFRLGVAYRMRYDSEGRRDADFQKAVAHWGTALEIDPNQYIWRRRIQQYGPRLDKPYPFYDWVPTAREEIAARGDVPSPLVVEPRGSEFAEPVEAFATADRPVAEPDPLGRVLRDDGEFIAVETTAVPSAVPPGEVARVHFTFRPIVEQLAHWNNEADDMVVWVDPPEGWDVDSPMTVYSVPPEMVSQETRSVEVEIRAAPSAEGDVTIPAYALYYVCEDINGVCMYRRHDLDVEVSIER